MKKLFAIVAVFFVLAFTIIPCFAITSPVDTIDYDRVRPTVYINTGSGTFLNPLGGVQSGNITKVSLVTGLSLVGQGFTEQSQTYTITIYVYLNNSSSFSGNITTLYFTLSTENPVTVHFNQGLPDATFTTITGASTYNFTPSSNHVTIDFAYIDYYDFYSSGEQVASQASYQRGYDNGASDANSALRGVYEEQKVLYGQEQYSAGYNDGNSYGYRVGYTDGLGDTSAYQDGYVAGLAEEANLAAIPVATVNGIGNMFREMFNFEILGVNVAGTIAAILSIILVIIIARKVL